MGLDETASDRKAESRSARIGRLGESIEDVRQERRLDAAAGVPDDDLDEPPVRRARRDDTDRAAGRRVAKRVGDEIREDFADPDGIDVEERDVVVDTNVQLDAGAFGGGLEGRSRLRGEDRQIRRLAMERQAAALGQGDRPQVVDEPGEDVRLVENGPKVRGVPLVDAIEDRLDVALDDGQRGPQLVADVGQQAAAVPRRPRDGRPWR